MATYLITGGAGFIGSHLAEALIKEGQRVRVLDNFTSGRPENLASIDCELVVGDVRDHNTVASAVRGVEGVFHLAAVPSVAKSMEDPIGNQQNGEQATLLVLATARTAGVRRVVFSSSAAVYGEPSHIPLREFDATRPASFYGLSKLAGEHYARIFARCNSNFDAVSLRYFNVFGPRQDPNSPYSGVISIFIEKLRQRASPRINGDGLQTRDFVEVSNIVSANLLAMRRDHRFGGTVFNIGTGRCISLLELWQELSQTAGVNIAPEFGPERQGDIKHSCADITAATEQLNYSPTTDWKAGIKRIWNSVEAAS